MKNLLDQKVSIHSRKEVLFSIMLTSSALYYVVLLLRSLLTISSWSSVILVIGNSIGVVLYVNARILNHNSQSLRSMTTARLLIVVLIVYELLMGIISLCELPYYRHPVSKLSLVYRQIVITCYLLHRRETIKSIIEYSKKLQSHQHDDSKLRIFSESDKE